MKQIILVRHAKTPMDPKPPAGKPKVPDSPLSQFGIKQANNMGEFVKKYSYEAVFTSIYRRTIETAKVINAKDAPLFSSSTFNEYYVRPTGENMETVDMGIVRVMPKIYSLFDIYQNILIVGHSSINKTILQSMTNMTFSKASKYFNNLGEIQILRYDWERGDKTWKTVDSFIPKQK